MQCLYNISKKEVRDEVDFLHADKHRSFLQADFSTLGIKVSYKVILSLLIGMIKNFQRTQSNKFAIPLQNDIAPGQVKIPVSILSDKFCEKQTFPYLFSTSKFTYNAS